MRVEAYVLYEGYDYEGRNVMGIFSDEPSAFAELIDLMSGEFKPDFYDIVHYDTEGKYTLKQRWTRGTNIFNGDTTWMSRKQD